MTIPSIAAPLGLLSVVHFLLSVTLVTSLQLGDRSQTNRWTPVKVMDDVAQVSGGALHTLIVRKDGTLWAVGSNRTGQLGDGSTVDAHVPKQILVDVASASAGSDFSLVLKLDGSLWIFGRVPTSIEKAKNRFSNDRVNFTVQTKPLLVDYEVVSMSAGEGYALYIKNDQSLWAFGDNEHGRFGDGTKHPQVHPVKTRDGVKAVYAGPVSSLALDLDGTLQISGSLYTATLSGRTGEITNYDAVARDVVSMTNGLYLSADATLWGFGFAGYGNLGLGRTLDIVPPTTVMSGVSAVASSQAHTLILKGSGDVFACGGGPSLFGALGDGTNLPRVTPVVIMTDVRAIAVGSHHSLAIKKDGSLWAFGLNGYPVLR